MTSPLLSGGKGNDQLWQHGEPYPECLMYSNCFLKQPLSLGEVLSNVPDLKKFIFILNDRFSKKDKVNTSILLFSKIREIEHIPPRQDKPQSTYFSNVTLSRYIWKKSLHETLVLPDFQEYRWIKFRKCPAPWKVSLPPLIFHCIKTIKSSCSGQMDIHSLCI